MQYFDDSATEKMPPKKNEITCLSCGKLFLRLNSHLARAAECKAFYMNSAADVFVPKREPERETFFTTCAGCGRKFQRIVKHLGSSEKCREKHSIQNEQQLSAERSKVKKSKSDVLNAYAKKQHQRERYEANPEPKKNYRKAKYESNPESENQQKKDKYRANPDPKKDNRKAKYKCNPESELQQKKDKYRANPEPPKLNEKRKYASDAGVSKANYYKKHCSERQSYQLDYYYDHASERQEYQLNYAQENREERNSYQRDYERQKRLPKVFIEADERKRLKEFHDSIKKGLTFACICCHRLRFGNSVTEVVIEKLYARLEDMHEGLFDSCILYPVPAVLFREGKTYVCQTCYGYFKRSKRPPQSVMNGLQIDNTSNWPNYNDLESTLIAKRILFLKLFKLPKSRWSAAKDKVVNIPIEDNDLAATLEKVIELPRRPDNAQLVEIELKRKVEYKNKVYHQYVNVNNLVWALQKFKELKNPHYENVELNHELLEELNMERDEPEHENSDRNECKDSITSDTDEDDCLDVVKKNQFETDAVTMMVDENPQSKIVVNSGAVLIEKRSRRTMAKSTPIAPGLNTF